MSKDKIEEVKLEESKIEENFKYGIGPCLVVNMVKENRVYRFEMPIGASLVECEEACNECLKIVTKMKEEALAKVAQEAEKKAEEEKSESVDEDLEKEDK